MRGRKKSSAVCGFFGRTGHGAGGDLEERAAKVARFASARSDLVPPRARVCVCVRVSKSGRGMGGALTKAGVRALMPVFGLRGVGHAQRAWASASRGASSSSTTAATSVVSTAMAREGERG